VSPMGLFPLRGPLVSVAVPPRLFTEVRRVGRSGPPNRSPEVSPGQPPCTGHPVVGSSDVSSAASCGGGSAASLRGFLVTPRPGIALWAGFVAMPPEVCPGARVASRISAGVPSLPGESRRRGLRRPPWGFRRQRTLPRGCSLGRARFCLSPVPAFLTLRFCSLGFLLFGI
jgi:hypothetical protein